MKLKSSNKKTYISLAVLALCALAFFAFKTLLVKKTSKYPAPPTTMEKKTDLDLIQISLKEKSYLKLKKKRDKALKLGILEVNDTDYVPATITYNEEDFRAEIRLKGDWTDHLKGDKWSFRVKLKNDKTILGMRKFSIHRPATRRYINEWLYHKVIKEEDLIGLRYGFLEGVINIKKNNSNKYITKEVGIYAIEESFDKRTIESNKRKESVILKFSEDGFWNKVKTSKKVGNQSGKNWNEFMDFKSDYPITVFGESKVLEDPTMRNYFKLSKNLLEDLRSGNTTVDVAFDVKELALQNALLNLFGATHGIAVINIRFYYNPITSKLEPIAFDGNAGEKLTQYKHFLFTNKDTDSVYLKELAYAINKVVQPEYLDKVLQRHAKDLNYYKGILKKEFKGAPLLNIAHFKHNQKILIKELKRLKTKYALEDIDLTSMQSKETTVSNSLKVPGFANWKNNNIAFNKAGKQYKGNPVYKIERATSGKPSFVSVRDIKIAYGNPVEATILVQKGEIGNYFGVRLQGQYPTRADAVFNLETGKLKGVKKVGDFEQPSATIKPLGNDWFELKIKVIANTDDVKFIFGPTNKNTKVLNWEKPSQEKSNSYIDISSLKIETGK